MTSTLQLPAWAIHLLAVTIGIITFLGSNQEFMGAIAHHPNWIIFFHLGPAAFAYLGISQLSSITKQQEPPK